MSGKPDRKNGVALNIEFLLTPGAINSVSVSVSWYEQRVMCRDDDGDPTGKREMGGSAVVRDQDQLHINDTFLAFHQNIPGLAN